MELGELEPRRANLLAILHHVLGAESEARVEWLRALREGDVARIPRDHPIPLVELLEEQAPNHQSQTLARATAIHPPVRNLAVLRHLAKADRPLVDVEVTDSKAVRVSPELGRVPHCHGKHGEDVPSAAGVLVDPRNVLWEVIPFERAGLGCTTILQQRLGLVLRESGARHRLRPRGHTAYRRKVPQDLPIELEFLPMFISHIGEGISPSQPRVRRILHLFIPGIRCPHGLSG
mmetsp:Transcript_22316/g.55823  ORF Transcript_22316/g.55823 Transcript_22316/m.55823 type:complete len:233 (-) Transcript_22316:608-1306(-)